MVSPLGDRIVSLLATAESSVVIVAPFVKTAAMERLLSAVPAKVEQVTCVTRWLPEEVAAGVSDLEVLDVVNHYPACRLLLHARLHAKLFRADASRLVGSANVTGRALGWSVPPNLELLVDVPAHESATVAAFEKDLIELAIPATEEIREEVQKAALRAPGTRPEIADAEPQAELWIPRCPSPDRLWVIYSNDESIWQVISSAVRAGREDLASLAVPPHLPKPLFEQLMRAILVECSVVREFDDLALRGFEVGQGASVIKRMHPEMSEATALLAVEIVLRWMEYFLPGKYRRTSVAEIFVKSRQLG